MAVFSLPAAASLLLMGIPLAACKSTLFMGATIVAYDIESESLNVIRDGSLLVTDDRIAAVGPTAGMGSAPEGTTEVDVKGKIITPGFVDTHRHGWQTGLKTMASNTTLVEYFMRYSEYDSGPNYTADDVYYGQLLGLYEALNAGVTTTLDHAHHTWSNETAEAGLMASIESGARVIWCYAFHNVPNVNLTISDQVPHYKYLAEKKAFENSPTELGVAFDGWGPNPIMEDVEQIVDLIKNYNPSAITTHALGGAWGVSNMPTDVHAFEVLNTTVPFVFSHASFLTHADAQLLRSTDQYLSLTPESEMHYGHTHPNSHLILDQAALGVDTHMTFSTDILTQARLWLQATRRLLFDQVLADWKLAPRNPFSASQAFRLATRSGGRALRRDDLGVVAVGAKADLLVWDGDSPALLGWRDPVAAVMLHASVGDIMHVMVDGKFVKKDGKLTVEGYAENRVKFLESADRLQDIYAAIPLPEATGTWAFSGAEFESPEQVDIERGPGTGYDEIFIQK